MKQHAFVAMPFGIKPGADGLPIDFNAIYATLIKPALEAAGCAVFRADEEQRAGDIRADMFQELLVADLVVADLTLDNPNVWYELGVRHALRARGVVLVQGPRPSNPFDIYTDRKLVYGLKDGAPDPARIESDRDRITAMARETLAASTRRKVSPVYALLPQLRQPDWQQLLLDGDSEFGAAYREWRGRMEVARQKSRAGDILVLAGETPIRALAVEARFQAGRALMKLSQFGFALEQFETALAIDPAHLPSRQQRTVCLGRAGRFEESQQAAQTLTEEFPTDPEAWALAGRAAKDRWTQRWRTAPPALAPREAAAAEDALLEEAIAPYAQAFSADPSHYHAGINALTLSLLREHLGGAVDAGRVGLMRDGLRWAIACGRQREPRAYWPRASQAELSLLTGTREEILRDWRAAMAAAGRDWFALDSTRQTLQILAALEFRPEETALACALVDAEISRLAPPFVPRQVLLFSGHMVDAPDRASPRFPLAKVPAAEARMREVLAELDAGQEDLALTQGAAGGDLIFSEACLDRGLRLHWLQPLPEADFVEASAVRCAGAAIWRQRYFAAKARLKDAPLTMPAELGPCPKGADVWERGNLWLLHTALAHGPDKVRFVCLWDGGGGDGPGGTRHMVDEVKRRSGRVSWIDTRGL